MSRESLDTSRQQSASPLRARLAQGNAVDMQQMLPAPRFGAASTVSQELRRHASLQESGSGINGRGDA